MYPPAPFDLIGTPNLFRDLTGIELNQANAAAALKGAMETAQFFAGEAGTLAQQRFLQQGMDRNLAKISDARSKGLITDAQAGQLTESALRGVIGDPRPVSPSPSADPAVKRVLDRANTAGSASVKISRPAGTVEIKTGEYAAGPGSMDFDVAPPVVPQTQPSPLTCWAAVGAMLLSWKEGTVIGLADAADRAGPGWRQRLDAGSALSAAELASYAAGLGLTAEPPQSWLPRGILGLLQAHGPLWVVGDDAFSDNWLSHARIVTGTRGDGTWDATIVKLIDPASGTTVEETFRDFAADLHAADPLRTGLGIYHW